MTKLQMTADEIFQAIKELENEQRWKLLDMLHDEYFNKNVEGNNKEITSLKKDVEYLAGKISVHEMYFNRIFNEEDRD
ncbi:hypothetical protein QUF79_06085 [Fictibacillus enclensis]|uniref:hypothetical protein n=1 Tax=Fictibacillus enclensis TaxID=1017270 RepID=UPI0025A20FD4|nr:hypothetical protein [Fictibacillus enclensis]MDM5197584.1 hypothetical protein [Fictibacillus enclensis]